MEASSLKITRCLFLIRLYEMKRQTYFAFAYFSFIDGESFLPKNYKGGYFILLACFMSYAPPG